ncbi:MAG: ferritin [Verrucomicrobia subdivision 3 bacterium]|nr:ferritin [Limisphaerales bacterium]
MLISKKMNEAINRQICYEFSAMLQYVAIASHFVGESLHELAAHFYRQAEEERDHAMRFVKYILDAGGHVQIGDIPAPRDRFKNVEEAIQLSLDQEKKVTEQISQLVELAIKESDHITQTSLNWFVNEQLEEVSSMDSLLKVVQRAGEANMLYVEDYVSRHKTKSGVPMAGTT